MDLEPRTDGDIEPLRPRGMEVAAQLHAVTYLVVNAMLVAIWAAVGGGYFWPIWPIITWAPALVIHGWITYGRVHGH
ncbi:MAG TPA: 2TM domain-containing protein [Acidimicrobiales bacterium]|nr:2TM domain-containing protein [Acidimicrobiales bacterium]